MGDTTDVGAYTNTANFYGTYDQGGNLSEWNEAVIVTSFRGVRGGSYGLPSDFMPASDRFVKPPAAESIITGFRVASVPEPSSGLLGAFGMLALMQRRRR